MKILLVQTGFLGDIVLSTPVIRAISERHPGAEIWLLTTPGGEQLLRLDPLLSGIIVYDKHGSDSLFRIVKKLRTHSFDIAYSVHKSTRTALMLWAARIPVRIGFSDASCRFLYTKTVTKESSLHDVLRRLQIVEGYCGDNTLRLTAPNDSIAGVTSPYVVLVPGSVWATKRWKWEGFRDCAAHFLSKGRQVVLSGSKDEQELCKKVGAGAPVIDLSGAINLNQLLSLIKGAELVICNDSLSLHIASAFQIPTVSVFCATNPRFGFGPWRNWAVVVQAENLPCKPCRRHGGNRCPTGTELCMTSVSAQSVIQASEQVLEWAVTVQPLP